MNYTILLSATSLAAISVFTYYLSRFNNTVSIIPEQLKINMTGAIGVLESIYVHNAFQCIIGAAPVAIFSSASFELPLLSVTNTFYGPSCHGNYYRNSAVISVTSLISEFDNTSS